VTEGRRAAGDGRRQEEQEQPESAAAQSAGSLLRVLGVAFGLAVAVGNTIGAGILRTPGDVASWLPNPLWFIGIWVVGALYALLGANAIAELGTMMPRSGAQYVFARRAFGDYAGFLVGWIDWISTCASVAAIALVLGESASELARRGTTLAVGIAMASVVFFALLLIRGTKLGDRAQQITSLVKAIALLALVTACFVFAGNAPAAPSAPAAAGAAVSVFTAFILSAQAVIYAYDGWTGPIYFSEEFRDPAREIPRSMFGSLLVVALIYLLVNIAFVYAVPTSALAGSPLAAGTVARSIFGERGETIVRLVVVASLPSAVNALLLMAPRVLYGLGRDGLGMSAAARVNPRGTPTMGLLASTVVVLAFLATGAFATVLAIAAFFFVAQYTLSFIAVFVLRLREPAASRPYRAKGHPWTTGLVLLGSVAFLVSAVLSDRRNSLYALGILVASYPVFLMARRSPVPSPSAT
jgi:APA family basic amino acid/polyamine antiporter